MASSDGVNGFERQKSFSINANGGKATGHFNGPYNFGLTPRQGQVEDPTHDPGGNAQCSGLQRVEKQFLVTFKLWIYDSQPFQLGVGKAIAPRA